MKRFLLFWTIIAMALAVSAQERTNSNNANDFAQRETHVTTTEALNLGYTFMRTGGDTRSSNVRKQDLQLIYAGQAIDSLSQEVTDCYYVFALQPKGFVIVAADNRVEPILGYSYDNNFVVENMPDHVRGWLGNYEKQIEAVVKQNIAPEVETTTKWSRLKSGQSMSTRSGETVGPLLTTTWDQGQYYNAMCPEDAAGPDGHVYTGCVATAMAQIINYHQYPQHGRGSHSYYNNYGTLTVNYDSANYNYTLMPNALTSTSTTAGVNAVATLMRDCGVAVNMQYNAGESSAYAQEARAALMNFFKFSPNMSFAEKEYFTNDEWETMLRNDLDAGNPVYYSGYGSGGHAFVCDGYNANGYFSFNFGWSGYCNGWYLTSNVNPGGNIFNDSQSAIFGIVPDANGNVILGQMAGTSTFTVDEPLEFYHLMGHNAYEGSNYTNPCSNTVTFVSANNNIQLVADIMDFEDQNISVYDGNTTNVLLRELHGGSDNDFSPVVSTENSVTLNYSGNLYYAGFKLIISQDNGCRMVSNILASVDTTTVHLAWMENGNAIQWQIEYGEESFAHGNGTLMIVNNSTTDITFPKRLTKYDVYIRSVCGDDIYGPWKMKAITTGAPYWQDVVTMQPESFEMDWTDNRAIITCAEDFVWYSKEYNAYEATFVSDIDLGGYKWRPINYFGGSIQGNGHTISNLYIEEVNHYTGLASSCGGTINDLGIENSFVLGNVYTGAICGQLTSSGTLSNCYVVNTVVNGTDIVGGLTAANQSIIKNCFVNVNVSGNRWTGLMTGDSRGTIINCYATGSIQLRSYCYYAGISAYAASGKIKNCYSVDLPMGVIGYKGITEISDTSSFYMDGEHWTLRTQISFEDGLETNLLAALNKEVLQLNDGNIRTWTSDANINDGLPVLGDYHVVTCPNIANLTVQNIKQGNATGVVVDWEETGDASVWEIRYRPKNEANGSAVIVTTNSKPHTLYNLQLAQEYTFSVRSVCDSENHSGWVSQDVMVDLPFWTDIVTEQPDGFMSDPNGNIFISNAEGLAWLAVLVNGFHGNAAQTFEGKTITLTSDINLQGYRWYPIGRAWYANTNYWTSFNGSFYGNGHAITGMYINDWGHHLGLFGYAGYGSQETSFHDVVLTDGLVNCYYNDSDGGGYGGLLGAGVEVKEIIDCSSNITVKGIMEVGSLCGHLFDQEGVPTIVSNCYATGDVYGREATAGLIGDARGIIVQNCYATGNVHLLEGVWNPWYRGGLIGNFMSNSSVKNCYSTGLVEIDENCKWYGTVIGCPYMNSHTQYVYGLLNDNMSVTGSSSSNDAIIDTASFYNSNNGQVLVTPITIDGNTYITLLDVLNAWVTKTNDPMLKTWSVDTANVNGGYPVFGDNYEPSCYNPTNVCVTNATIVGDSTIRTQISWEQEGTPSSWEVMYVIPSQSVDSGTIVAVASNPCVLTGLPVGQLLDFYVRAVCDADDISGWSNSARYIPDKLHWTEVVTSQPDGYYVDNENNVYISTAEGLSWLSSVMNKLNGNTDNFIPNKVILTSDIDLSTYRWTSIASFSECNSVFEGNGHTIRGLYCNENANNQGLFGNCCCMIQNVFFAESSIRGLLYNGTIAGRSGGIIRNCIVNGEVIGVQDNGGICGEKYGDVINTAFVGMVDTRYDVSISNCFHGYLGGITASGSSTVVNSYVAGEITESAFSGIITSTGTPHVLVSNCYYRLCPTDLPITYDGTNTSNNSSFTGSGNTWSLNTPPYIGGYFYSDLVSALNAWVDANNTEGVYRRWAADSTGINGGYPVFANIPCVTVTSSDTIVACDSYTWNGTIYTESGDYSQTFTNASGCDSIVTLHLTIYPTPTVVISGNQNVCETEPVFLTASVEADGFVPENLHFTWYESGQIRDNMAYGYGDDSIYVEHMYPRNEPYHYSVEVSFGTDLPCVSQSGEYLVYVHTLPIVNLTATETSICVGGTTTIMAEATGWDENTVSYNWSNGYFGSSYTFSPASSGSYTFTVTATNLFSGCTSIDEITIEVNDIPETPIVAANNTMIFDGGQVTLSVTNSVADAIYTWYRNGELIEGANQATLVENPLSVGGETSIYSYNVVAALYNSGCVSAISSNTDVTVAPSPVAVVTVDGNTMLCEGGSTTLHVEVTPANIPYTYQWYVDNEAVSGATSADFVFAESARMTPYSIYVVISANGGYNGIAYAPNITVVPQPAVVVTISNDNVCEGETLTLNANVSGTIAGDALTYQWYQVVNGNTVAISGAESPIYSTSDLLIGSSYNFYVVVTSSIPGCSVASDTLETTVQVMAKSHTDSYETACESFTWIDGVTYTESTDTPTFTLTNAAGCDSVVTLHLTVNYGTHNAETEVACDSYEWHGETYTTGGTYTYEYTNVDGCPSVDTLYLTINYSTTGIDEQTACESFTWIDGVTYTESTNTPTFTLTNAAGCDSVVTLHLTVNYGTHNAETEVACDSYEWHGESYTTSGMYMYEYTNADGCPSVDTLYLTINYSTTGIDEQVACESFTWIDGVTYTESTNTPTFTLTNVAGCDSVVTLHLTVNYGTHNAETEVVCDSYEWNDETYTTTGVYTYEYTNADGCPSVDTLYLTINNSTTGIDEQTACESFTWIDGVTYTVSTNTPTFTLTNAAGCDSVVTLHLIVNYGTHNAETEVACDSYEWNGETYTTTGVYTYEYTNADGCPSVDTLYLTINNSTTGIDEQVACESFTWIDGVTYTESTNTPTFTLTNAAGCDSVVTLNLTVNYGTHNIETEVVCDSYEWYGETYATTGVYTYEYTNADGCPSVDTLHLTINYSTTGIDEQTACEAFTWIDGVTYTESTNTPTFTLTNAAGCDSVVTLHLIIYESTTSEFSIVTDDPCYIWNDMDYCESGDYIQTFQTIYGCDSIVTLHLTITVGIDDHETVDFKVFPNPTTGVVNVECTMNNVQLLGAEIQVVDMYGKLVDVVGANNYSPLRTAQIDLSLYASGVYFVKLVAEDKTIAVRKVVKQ